MFFDSWTGLARVLVVGFLAYTCLLILLRATGKRTLSKLNAFDLIVTVALGSTLSSILISGTVALAEGVLALALLVLLQFAVTWVSVRWKAFGNLVKAQPSLLFYRGEFLDQAMKKERVTRDEITSVMRAAQIADFQEVEAVVLETAGDLHVIRRADGDARTLDGVKNPATQAKCA